MTSKRRELKSSPIRSRKDALKWRGASLSDFLAAVMKGHKGCRIFYDDDLDFQREKGILNILVDSKNMTVKKIL